MTHRIFFIVVLWLSLGTLALITFMAFVASSTRSDCDFFGTSTINIAVTLNACTPRESLSATVYHHAAYFQSAHITIIQAIAASSLIVFKPSLLAMAWSAMASPALSSAGVQGLTMSLSVFQSVVDLVNSPALIPSVLYTKASHSLTPPVAFVLVVSVLSLLSPIAVSPIYRSHTGPFDVAASIMNGGGVGPSISFTFNSNDPVPGGVVAGRALINAGTTSNTTIYPAIFDISVAPFISRGTIQAIWHTQVETVVARNALDCGSTARTRLSNSSQDLVTLDDVYFAPNRGAYSGIQPSFAGQILGPIDNDPAIIVVYLNSTFTVAPGVVEAQTSVVFLVANGTLEGAQQRITSPEPTSRIKFVDVLVCTSTTRLEISMCTIDKGTVSRCDFHEPANLSSSSTTGGVDIYIKNPISVAITIAASPVTAYYILGNRLPMLSINQEDIDSKTPPLSFLTYDTALTLYNIPLTYVTNVLFVQTAQGLVQGMVPAWPTYTNQPVSLISVFGTSKPALLFAIMAMSLASALIATLASTLPRSARHASALDVSRILVILRGSQLDTALQPYLNWSVEMEEEILSIRVGYGRVEALDRDALMMAPQGLKDELEKLVTHDPVFPQMVTDVDGSRHSGPVHDDAEQS
jgi:hypothetical protein